jgi:hypothetical protein
MVVCETAGKSLFLLSYHQRNTRCSGQMYVYEVIRVLDQRKNRFRLILEIPRGFGVTGYHVRVALQNWGLQERPALCVTERTTDVMPSEAEILPFVKISMIGGPVRAWLVADTESAFLDRS